MERHSESAAAVAERLAGRTRPWPRCSTRACPTHPGHDVAAKQMSAFGGMVSIRLAGGEAAALEVCRRTELFTLAESLGAVESLIEHPGRMTHASVAGTPNEVPADLVRLSRRHRGRRRPPRRPHPGPRVTADGAGRRSTCCGRGGRSWGCRRSCCPHRSSIEVDWAAFEAHVTRTADAGLTPAVNMDTGFVHLLTAEQRAEVLSRTRSLGVDFVAGAFDEADVEAVQALGGTPVLFPSDATARRASRPTSGSPPSADRFIGFELSPVFHPDGRIWDLDTYRAVLDIPQCIGAKHSSLERQPEWDRLRLRDEVRPDFLVLTGNDLAIDMVMYGSDYLLGLSTFAPAEFAARDRCWADGRRRRLPPAATTCSSGSAPPPSARRCPPTATTPRCSSSSAAGRRATPPPRARRAARRGSASSSPSILDRARGGGVAMRRRDFPQVKNLKTRRRVPRPPRRRSASPSRSPTRPTSTRSRRRSRWPGGPAPTASASSRWRGGTAPTTAARPTSCAAAGSASAPAAPAWCGAARRSRCARTVGPTPTSSASGPSSADDLAELHGLLDPEQVTGLQLTHSGRWSVEPRPGPRRPAPRRPPHRARAHRRRARRPRRRLRHRRPARAATPASTSST